VIPERCEPDAVPGGDEVGRVRISVVISTLDRPRTLARCLDALLAGSVLPTEVIVVDQGDPAATAVVLDGRRRPDVPLVHVTQERRGLSASQNAGVRRASCPVVAIIDDDCVPDGRWVEVAAREHGARRLPLLLGGRVLALPAVGERTIPLALRESTEPRRLSSDAMPWDLGTGGNFSVTRASYLLVDGNDERLGTGSRGRAGNDIDLFRRLMRTGVQARFAPDSLVLHERATPAEARSRSWTYGFGVGACLALWLGDGDGWAVRASVEWAKMRLRLLQSGFRRRGSVLDEVRVLVGTLHGIGYGAQLVALDAARRRASWVGRGGRRTRSFRFLQAARHPFAAVTRVADHLSSEYRLPAGRTARLRRLLAAGVAGPDQVLVLGPSGPVRQAWPRARLDVVGESPEAGVTVVSDARGPGSLPRRWDCVVLTDPSPEVARISAAVGACRPHGIVVIRSTSGPLPALPPHAAVERVLRGRGIRLVLARVAS
jgi:glycosyltransferase involved in cell wall biosynthesis